MTTLTLRLPIDLHQELTAAATADKRSLNQEIVWLLDAAISERRDAK